MNESVLAARRLRRELPLAAHIDSLPPWVWLAMQAAALWPSLAWAARRMADGSDEPLGLVALALLALAIATGRTAYGQEARLPWLVLAIVLTLAASVLAAVLPPLAIAMLSALALASAFAAFRAPGTPWLPVAGLLLLALPLVASLQFYAGWPLRVITAEASRWLLMQGGIEVVRLGTTLHIDGREVLVDAPCSGVQLAWFGYCAACASALWHGLRDARFAARLPLTGLLVLAANVLRNTALVPIEAGLLPAPAWLHEAIGLAALGVVVVAAAYAMQRGSDDVHR